MSGANNWIWAEIVLLIGLLAAFVTGTLDARTYAHLCVGVLVVFAVPAFMKLANTRQGGKSDNG